MKMEEVSVMSQGPFIHQLQNPLLHNGGLQQNPVPSAVPTALWADPCKLNIRVPVLVGYDYDRRSSDNGGQENGLIYYDENGQKALAALKDSCEGFQCNVCGMNFYSEKYYTMHLNSNEHLKRQVCNGKISNDAVNGEKYIVPSSSPSPQESPAPNGAFNPIQEGYDYQLPPAEAYYVIDGAQRPSFAFSPDQVYYMYDGYVYRPVAAIPDMCNYPPQAGYPDLMMSAAPPRYNPTYGGYMQTEYPPVCGMGGVAKNKRSKHQRPRRYQCVTVIHVKDEPQNDQKHVGEPKNDEEHAEVTKVDENVSSAGTANTDGIEKDCEPVKQLEELSRDVENLQIENEEVKLEVQKVDKDIPQVKIKEEFPPLKTTVASRKKVAKKPSDKKGAKRSAKKNLAEKPVPADTCNTCTKYSLASSSQPFGLHKAIKKPVPENQCSYYTNRRAPNCSRCAPGAQKGHDKGQMGRDHTGIAPYYKDDRLVYPSRQFVNSNRYKKN